MRYEWQLGQWGWNLFAVFPHSQVTVTPALHCSLTHLAARQRRHGGMAAMRYY